jgi:hypothetical protein
MTEFNKLTEQEKEELYNKYTEIILSEPSFKMFPQLGIIFYFLNVTALYVKELS